DPQSRRLYRLHRLRGRIPSLSYNVTFRLELDGHVDDLRKILEPQLGNLESEVRPHLGGWFEDTVMPVHRVVNLFQEKLAYLLHAALSYTPVIVVNSTERTQNDISRFQSSAGLQGLVQEGTMTSLCVAMTEQQQRSVTVDLSDGQPQLVSAGRTATYYYHYCYYSYHHCCNNYYYYYHYYYYHYSNQRAAFMGGASKLICDWLLQVIQDMNNLKRLIRQAESSHYALFRCYNFLKNCGNGDILLQIVKVEHAEMAEARSVVTVLEEFIREEGFSVHDS
ncbi:protein Njmu-R1, partial [Hyla sarda]|uniref:protein Njmu-R1 n=1 Tax=Hyla sarda TaxID=327740 RepID=UPI0024C3B3C4